MLGLAAVSGCLLAVGTVALAGPDSSPRTGALVARATGTPSPAPLAILSHQRTAKDDLPAGLVATVADLAGGAELAPEVRNGTVLTNSSHLALVDVGASRSSFYVVPTSNGRICLVITNGPQGCEEAFFTDAQPGRWGFVDADGYRHGLPTSVHGLVPNNVDRVTVIDDHGARTDARLANNAYYIEVPSSVAMPTEIVLSFADGGSASLVIPTLPVG